MNGVQAIIFVGSGSIFSIALLLWFFAAIAAMNGNAAAKSFTCYFALFFTGISGALLIWALNMPA